MIGKLLVLWGEWTTGEQFDLNSDQNDHNHVASTSHRDLA